MTGSITFYLTLHSTNFTRKVVKITSDLVNLSAVLSEYHEYADIFSKAKAETLAFYYLYNL